MWCGSELADQGQRGGKLSVPLCSVVSTGEFPNPASQNGSGRQPVVEFGFIPAALTEPSGTLIGKVSRGNRMTQQSYIAGC